MHQRNVDHAELDDLKAYALIFAVKNNFHETFTQLSRTISSNGDHTNINTQRTPLVVAFSLASQPKGSKRDETNEQDYISAYTSTFFGWAVYHGHTALVALLLSERVIWDGALFEKVDSDENRVGLLQRTLKYINKGNEETAQLLLDSFLKMVDRNECEFEALCESAKAGLDMVVRLLLRGTESLKHRKKRNGDNALQIAARNHRSIVVEECLKLGFDIDAKGRHEETPLMTAINSKSEQVVALLLDRGANANAKNVRGKRITHAALMSSLSEETVQQILAKAFEARSLKQSHSFQPKTKWRRADVNVDMDTSLKAGIFLDSYYAFFEEPQKFDCDVRDQHRRHIRLDQRQIRELSFQFGILFHPYPKPSLDISVRLYLEDDNRQYSRHEGRTFQGWKEKQKDEGLGFRIVNGGEFRIKLGDESQGLYHSFNDIATDPNAELVDSDKDASHWNMKCGRRKLLQ